MMTLLRKRFNSVQAKPCLGASAGLSAQRSIPAAALEMKFGAELGMILITLGLVAGALVGSGFAASNLGTVDPLAWLANRDGGITRVNPQTGRAVEGLKISQNGANLQVTQADGILTIIDPTTNELVVIDLSLLSVAGKRGAGPNVEVLVTTGKIFTVNKDIGELSRINALNASTIGRPVRLERRLADTTAATDGAVWLLDQKGELQSQKWSDPQGGFVPGESRVITGAGDKAVLVAHGSGVTVVDPTTRTATQVGTEGADKTTTLPPIDGPLVAADISPPDLAVVSSPERSELLVVKENDPSIVDTARRGCRKPGKPVVFRDRIYAACPGDRKVIVVDPDGGPGQDIVTPPGEQIELVFNAGMLLVNVRDGQNGLVIMPDGAVREIRTHDPSLPVTVPTPIPSAMPSNMDGRNKGPQNSPRPNVTTGPPRNTGSPGPTATGNPRGGSGSPSPGRTGQPTASPARTPVPPPSSPAPNPARLTPTGVGATARPDGSVQVSWTAPQLLPASYRVVRADNPSVQLATVGGAARFAIIPPGLPLGQPVSFYVEAVAPDGKSYRSAQSSPQVTPFNAPGAPAIQNVVITARTPASITLRVTIEPTSDGGSTLSTYDVTLTDSGGRSLAAAQGVPIGQRPLDLTVSCTSNGDICLSGGDINVRATVFNTAGGSPPADRASNIPYPAPYDRNGDTGATIMIISSGGKCLDRTGRDEFLRTCNGAQSQLWRALNTGDIHSVVDNWCLFTDDDGKLTLQGSNCTQSEHRYNDVGVSRNDRFLRNDDHGGCILPIGDPAGEGVPVRTNGACTFSAAERWTFFKPVQPLQPVSYGRSSVPATVPGVMLLVLALGLIQIRYRPAADRARSR